MGLCLRVVMSGLAIPCSTEILRIGPSSFLDTIDPGGEDHLLPVMDHQRGKLFTSNVSHLGGLPPWIMGHHESHISQENATPLRGVSPGIMSHLLKLLPAQGI